MKSFFYSLVLCLLLSAAVFSQGRECVVRAQVVLLDTGKIGDVTIISNSCNDKRFDEQAIEAARKIEFKPQKENGKSITTTRTVEYKFSLFDEKAEAILKKAVEQLGSDRYLNVKTQVSRGKFSVLREGAVISFQSFLDVIVFPDKERTEFKGGGTRLVQTNVGNTGWIYDGDAQTVKDQNADQIANFKRGIRVSLDNLLRGGWRGDAILSYVGKRQASLGKRNDVVKLVYTDGLTVEYEFSDDGLPAKAIYKLTNPEGEDTTEEDRYAQFVEVQGVKTPFIIDRFSNGQPSSRINFETIEYDRRISDSIFNKPSSAKEAKKDLKL